jgi:hypothetical protein
MAQTNAEEVLTRNSREVENMDKTFLEIIERLNIRDVPTDPLDTTMLAQAMKQATAASHQLLEYFSSESIRALVPEQSEMYIRHLHTLQLRVKKELLVAATILSSSVDLPDFLLGVRATVISNQGKLLRDVLLTPALFENMPMKEARFILLNHGGRKFDSSAVFDG